MHVGEPVVAQRLSSHPWHRGRDVVPQLAGHRELEGAVGSDLPQMLGREAALPPVRPCDEEHQVGQHARDAPRPPGGGVLDACRTPSRAATPGQDAHSVDGDRPCEHEQRRPDGAGRDVADDLDGVPEDGSEDHVLEPQSPCSRPEQPPQERPWQHQGEDGVGAEGEEVARRGSTGQLEAGHDGCKHHSGGPARACEVGGPRKWHGRGVYGGTTAFTGATCRRSALRRGGPSAGRTAPRSEPRTGAP